MTTSQGHRYLPTERWAVTRLSERRVVTSNSRFGLGSERELRNYGSVGCDLLNAARADAAAGAVLLVVVAIIDAAVDNDAVGVALFVLLPLFALSLARTWQAAIEGRSFRDGRPMERSARLTGNTAIDDSARSRRRSLVVSTVITIVGAYLAIPGLILAILGRHDRNDLVVASVLTGVALVCSIIAAVKTRELRRLGKVPLSCSPPMAH